MIREESGYSVSADDALGDMLETLARAGMDELIMPRKQTKRYDHEIYVQNLRKPLPLRSDPRIAGICFSSDHYNVD